MIFRKATLWFAFLSLHATDAYAGAGVAWSSEIYSKRGLMGFVDYAVDNWLFIIIFWAVVGAFATSNKNPQQ